MPIKIPQKELDVLAVLLRSDRAMTISDIVNSNPDYTVNMIKPIIRKLCQLKIVEIEGITYRGTSIARTFCPTLFKIFFKKNTIVFVNFSQIILSYLPL